jgi:hypothetical protein
MVGLAGAGATAGTLMLEHALSSREGLVKCVASSPSVFVSLTRLFQMGHSVAQWLYRCRYVNHGHPCRQVPDSQDRVRWDERVSRRSLPCYRKLRPTALQFNSSPVNRSGQERLHNHNHHVCAPHLIDVEAGD